ncbi:glycosyltransferase family 2 protein [Phocaeicola barnesiae]
MKVSVVMASCNPDMKRIRLAINSILNQTFQDYEIIIVDDGSKRPIENSIKSISRDPRIKVLRIENSGLGAALNHGIQSSKGEYIARLDDDDMMVISRLQKQVDFLDKYQDVSCVGTFHYDMIERKSYKHRRFPTDHNRIVESLINCRFSLAHTTLMFRRSAFDKIGGYRIQRGGQDLDLELQLGSVGRLANISEYLNFYTMSSSGLGTINPTKYKAYLFALNDVVSRNIYPDFTDKAKRTIARLERIDNSPLKSFIEKFKRYALRTRVILLGTINADYIAASKNP